MGNKIDDQVKNYCLRLSLQHCVSSRDGTSIRDTAKSGNLRVQEIGIRKYSFAVPTIGLPAIKKKETIHNERTHALSQPPKSHTRRVFPKDGAATRKSLYATENPKLLEKRGV